MPKLKRKGMTFVTEHYVDQEGLDAIEKVLIAFLRYMTAKHDSFAHGVKNHDEISMWADPQGVFFSWGHSLPQYPLPWREINIDKETAGVVLRTMMDVFQKYGDSCKNRQFKIVLNETTFRKITMIYHI